MFGYVRPLRDELKMRDYDRFQAAYCGLCRAIGERYGAYPRLFLNYDLTFLAVVLSAGEGEHALCHKRCPASILRKKAACVRSPAFDLAADESVILTYRKLRDAAEDEGFFRGFFARVLSWLMYRPYRKARRLRPEFDRRTTESLSQLRNLERENSPSLDRCADTFAQILSAAAQELGDPARVRPVGQMLYHVGRWIYLADAYHDRKKDRKLGVYNPVLARFSDGPELRTEDVSALRTTMNHSLNLAASAYQLVPFGLWSEVVANILYLGLPTASELVLSDRWEPMRANKRKQI